MESRIEVSWTCRPCEVGGQDTEVDAAEGPTCWNCGGPVVVTARPTVRTAGGPDRREGAPGRTVSRARGRLPGHGTGHRVLGDLTR